MVPVAVVCRRNPMILMAFLATISNMLPSEPLFCAMVVRSSLGAQSSGQLPESSPLPASHSPFPQQFGIRGSLMQPPRGSHSSTVHALPSSHIVFSHAVGECVGGGVVGEGVGNGVPDPAASTAFNELTL